MKILVICQYYYPEPFRIADICEELVKKGDEVTVITGIPNYPMGEIYEGYKGKEKLDEVINGVKVHRCYTIPRKKGIINRFLNYYSFSISSSIYVGKLKGKYDMVFVNQLSPIMMANAGLKYKKKNNTKLILYCLDLWPESVCAGGIKEKSILYKYFYRVSKKIYSNCDKILVTSKSFIDYFKEKFNIDNKKIEYLPQYAESIFKPEYCKKEKDNYLDLLFAGNIGKAQCVDKIIDAANLLKKENIKFHIVGDGSEYVSCINKINELKLSNIKMYGREPIEKMPEYYKKADALIVTLCGDSIISYTLPGKVQSYMASGKPIIAMANGETKNVIEDAKCGFCGLADDVTEFVDNIKKFMNVENKEKLGINSYKYYEENFNKEKFIIKLLNIFKEEI